MPIRSPLGLGFALAALVLAQSGARAEPAAGTWTDPPARSAAPVADTAAPPRAEAAPERAAEPSAKRSAKTSAKTSSKTADRVAPDRAEPVRMKSVRAARTSRHRAVAARRPEPAARSAPVRVARPLQRDWPAAEPVYVMPRPYDPRDPRLERLWSAEEAGYLAVRGRHVAYPDGRTLRIYRPSGEEEDLD